MGDGTRRQGERHGPFVLDHPLGGGESTEVWAATGSDGNRVALKLIRKASHNAWSVTRLAREVAALDRLGDLDVVELLDVGEDDAEPWLAFRYEPHGTLDDHVANVPLDVADAAATLWPVANTLADAHSRGVVHRDVKPANVILGETGPILADWGAAAISGTTFDGSLHGTRAVVGTPEFLAPEAMLGARPAPPLDVFALGVTFARAVGIDPTDPSAPAMLRTLVVADPLHRPSMAEVATELQLLAAGRSPATAPAPSSRRPPSTDSSSDATERLDKDLGRRPALDTIRRLRQSASTEKELASALLSAPPGSGKSWLLAAAASDAATDGWLVLRATCDPVSRDVRCLTPWVRAAYSNLDAGGRDQVIADRHLAALLDEARPSLDVSDQRSIGDALALVLRLVAPVMCVLDDVHLASEELVEILEGLAFRPSESAFLLMACRPGTTSADDLGAITVELGELDESSLDTIISTALGRPALPAERSMILAGAGGNPMFVREAALAIAGGGDVAGRSLVDLVSSRVDGMDTTIRRGIEVAAVCGTAFWPELLGDDVVQSTEAMLAAGLAVPRLRSRIPGSTELHFAHPLFYEVSESLAPPDRRFAAAARVATALDATGAEPELFVRQAALAVDGGFPELRDIAGRAALGATRGALDHLAVTTAASHLALAVRFAAASPELTLLEAETEFVSGRPTTALALLNEHADSPETSGLAARRLALAAARAAGELEIAERLGTRLLGEVEFHSASWADVAGILATVLARRGRPSEAVSLADEAREVLRNLGDPVGEALAAVAGALAFGELEFEQGQVTRATATRVSEASHALRRTDPRRWVHVAASLVDALYPSDWDAAWRLAEAAAGEALELDDAHALAGLAYFCADFAFERGEPEACDRWLALLEGSSTEIEWKEHGAEVRALLDHARQPEDAGEAARFVAAVGRGLRRQGNDQWIPCSFAAASLFLWAGRPAAAMDFARDHELPLDSEYGRVFLDVHDQLVSPDLRQSASASASSGFRHDTAAFHAYVIGDRETGDAAVRERLGHHGSTASDRPLRLIGLYPGYLVWALGPPDTEPPIEWFRSWFHHSGMPGLWVVHRAIVGMILAERGESGFTAADVRRLMSTVVAEPGVSAWINERLDTLEVRRRPASAPRSRRDR